ncbi:hypothetical protein [Streptomyces justiciae]|uniref:hypothetical protein n=1 Tax=Streptomyces justiciae TaxID=2780140 RepID=UPI002117AA91|nr:hypothetical protein [Streptomyces justiciae]MCW8383928.1 hypothetical protein [Streptomyces justiciae]
MRDTNPSARQRLTRLIRRILAVPAAAAALVLGPQAAAANATTLAAVKVNTDGLNDILLKNALPAAIAFIGVLIVLNGRKKDTAGGLTMAGITLLGLGVVGMATMATPIGDALVGLVIDEG